MKTSSNFGAAADADAAALELSDLFGSKIVVTALPIIVSIYL